MRTSLPFSRLQPLREVCLEWWARFALAAIAILIVGAIGGIRVNVTESLPLGLYRKVGDGATVRPGDVVVVCLPEEWGQFAVRRNILGPGRCSGNSYGIGKLVVAMEGDVVDLHQESLVINGVSLSSNRTLDRDHLGRRMPHFPWGIHALGPSQVWLFSPHPAAFDSRYFGPVPASRIRSVVRPVWTRPTAKARLRRCEADTIQEKELLEVDGIWSGKQQGASSFAFRICPIVE